MRTLLSILSATAILATVAISCKKDQETDAPFELSTNELEFSNEGGTLTIEVKTTANWTASTEDEWISVVEKKENGKGTASVTALKNEAEAGQCAPGRTGKITFKHGTKSEEVTVVQSAETVIFKVNKDSFDLPKEGGNVTIQVTSNYPYSVTSTPDWIRLSETKAGATASISLIAEPNDITIERSGDVVIATNKGRELTVTVTEAPSDVIYGDGTKEKPLRIYIVSDLEQVRAKLADQVAGQTVYVELCQDIDMASVENWQPFWPTYGEYKPIDFNGLNHTISNMTSSDYVYSSFIGFATGVIRDVTFANAKIQVLDSGSSRGGVIAGLAGDTGKEFKAVNVHAVDCEIVAHATHNHIGGLCGATETGILEDCSFTGKITDDGTGAKMTAGLVGYTYTPSTISRCWSDAAISLNGGGGFFGGIEGAGHAQITDCYALGDITIAGYIRVVGGISGNVEAGGSLINCYSTSAVWAHNCAGGICGKVDAGYDNVVKGCIAWNKSVKSLVGGVECNQGDADYYSAAYVVGSAKGVTLTDNYRSPDAVFQFYSSEFGGHPEINYNDLFDQENTSESAPLAIPSKYIQVGEYWPYHGKAAPAGSTVSSVAKTLKWDEAVWDLSKDLPTLKSK